MIRINKFEDLKFVCKVLAAALNTLVEIKEYEGWAQIVFMTDKFGGVYAILHYDFGTGSLHNNYGMKDEVEIDSISMLYEIVKEGLENILKERDLAEVSDFINAEYY